MPAPRPAVVNGDRYGRLTVLQAGARDSRGHRAALVRCDCGTARLVQPGRLLSGNAVSCGCTPGTPRLTRGQAALALFADRGFGPDSPPADRERIIRELSAVATLRELAGFFRITPGRVLRIAAAEQFAAISRDCTCKGGKAA